MVAERSTVIALAPRKLGTWGVAPPSYCKAKILPAESPVEGDGGATSASEARYKEEFTKPRPSALVGRHGRNNKWAPRYTTVAYQHNHFALRSQPQGTAIRRKVWYFRNADELGNTKHYCAIGFS